MFPLPSGWPATRWPPAWILALIRAACAQRNLHRQNSAAGAGSQERPVRAERSEPRSGGSWCARALPVLMGRRSRRCLSSGRSCCPGCAPTCWWEGIGPARFVG
jgi:hypothetical protein